MELDEIIKYLISSRDKEICVSKELLLNYDRPIVREIYILNNSVTRLEFNDYGYDEGGFTIYLKYNSLNELIHSLENFLNTSISAWQNYNKTGNYPTLVDYCYGSKKLQDDLKSKSISLPFGWTSYEIKENYWSQFLK